MSLNKDDIVKAVREREKQATQSSVYSSTLGDQYKPEVYELASKLSVPPGFVHRNYEKLNQQSQTDLDYDDLTKNSPTLARWVQDNEYAKLMAKDIENLSYIEKQLKYIGSQYEQGDLNVELSDIGQAAVIETIGGDPVSPELRARQAEIKTKLKNYNYGITGFVEQIPGAVAGQIPVQIRTIRDRLAATGTGAATGASVGAVGGAIAGAGAGGVGAVPGAIAGATTGASVGARVGWKYGSAVAAGRMEMNHAFLDYEGLKDETGAQVDKNVALGAAALVGTVNGIVEMVGFEKVISKIPGIRKFTREGIRDALTKPTTGAAIRRYASTIAQIMVIEGATEAFQAITKQAGELILKNEYASTDDFLADLFSEENLGKYLEEARVGAQSGGGMTAVVTLPQLALDVREVKKAEQREKAFLELGEAMKKSSTVTQTPETASKLVEQMGEGEVYIDKKQWDTYWQSKNMDPKEAAKEVLGDTSEYESLSDDIRIPIGRYASKIAPTEHNQFFASELKLEPEGMSARQALELEQAMDKVTPEQEDAIKPVIVERLMAAGFNKETAEDYATQNSAFIHTMAERSGSTPEAILDKYGFEIQREGVPAEIVDSTGAVVTEDRRAPVQEPMLEAAQMPGDRRKSQPGRGDRRKETEQAKRELLKTLPPDQQELLLKSDVIPALLGKRAFEIHMENNPSDQVMFFDFDDFKKVNDKLGEKETDRSILEVAGELIREEAEKAGIKAYHRSGDEFFGVSASQEQLATFAENVRERLKNHEFVAILPNGNEETFPGIGFSYGIGSSEETARSLSKQQKAERKAAGLRTGARDAGPVAGQTSAGDQVQTPGTTTLKQSKAPPDAGVSASGQTDTDYNKRMLVDPNKLIFREEQQNRLNEVRELFPEGSEYSPIVVIQKDNQMEILDGHNRAAVAMERGDQLPAVTLTEQEYNKLKDSDFDDMEISYAALSLAGEDDAASALNRQFPGAGVASRGVKAEQLLDRYRSENEQDSSPPAPPSEGRSRLGQTKTPEFRRWFGDSKVVDENGEPLVVYHGTKKPPTQFDKSRTGKGYTFLGDYDVERFGIFVTADPEIASLFSTQGEKPLEDATVMPLYASIKNPIDMQGPYTDEIFNAVESLIDKRKSEGADYHSGYRVARLLGEKWNSWELFDQDAPNDAADWISIFKEMGFDGARIYEPPFAGEGKSGESWVAFEPSQIKSAIGNVGTFDPGNPNILMQPPPKDGEFIDARGSIQISPSRHLKISLLQNADLSTFIHESGHAYLEILRDIVEALSGRDYLSDLQKGLLKDAEIIAKWLGVDSLKDVTVEHHEKFARGFEAYTFEGQAPSIGLRRAFARFRSWMLAIYKKLKALNVQLNDDVRGVFDRMLATDQQIEEAKREAELIPIFTTKPENMTDEVFNAYRSALEKSNVQAREHLEQKLFKEMMRERKAWWKEESEKVAKQVEAELNEQKNYIALSILQTGKYPDGTVVEGNLKLDRDSIQRAGFDKGQMKKLNGLDVYRVENGLDIDLAAQLFGYASGPELVQTLLNTPKKSVAIAKETRRRMLETYGDIMGDASQLAEQARQAVLGEGRSEVVHQEMKTLNEILKTIKPVLKDDQRQRAEGMRLLRSVPKLATLKFWASNEINRIKIRDLRPNKYWTTMRAASREALKAVNQKDFQKAYDQKQKELLNLELYRQATAAIEESESIVKFLRKFERPAIRERLGKVGRLEQVEALLDYYDLRRISNKQIDANKARYDLLKAIESGEIAASREFTKSLAGSDRKNYRDETIEVLRGLRDTLRQMDKQAIGEYEVLVGEEKFILSQKAQELADSVLKTGKSVMPAYGQMSPEEKLGKTFKNLINTWFRPATMARLLDGSEFGSWTKNIIEPIRKAVTEKLEPMLKKAEEDLANLYRKHYSVKEMMRMNERSLIPGINVSLSRWDLISIGLNWGNAENRKAILEGRFAGNKPFTEAGVLQALGTLDKRDWEFIQETWDHIDSYWPQIKASQERRRGVAPPKVDADPFTMKTRDGHTMDLKGGYYPLKYNKEIDPKAQQKEMDSLFDGMKLSKSAQTKYAHNQERIGSGGQPVLLSMNVLHGHINHVVRDLALGDTVIYVDKVLRRQEVKQAMTETGNLDSLKTFQLWLKDTAAGEMGARSGAEAVARFLRLGFTKSKIGFNVVTTALQLAGLPQTITVVGKKNFSRGAMDYLKAPKQSIQQVMAQSQYMYNRYQLNAFNKDIQAVQEALKSGSPSTTAKNPFLRTFLAVSKNLQLPPVLVNWAFLGIRYTQMQVDTITWLAGYHKAKDMNLSAEDAVKFADSQVDKAQGSGIFSDRSSIERGTLSEETRQTEFVKLWTTLMSYMIAKGNIAVERYTETDFRKLNQVLSFGTDMLLLFSAEIILMAAIKGDSPEEDESWLWWMTKRTAEQVVSTIPVLREIPSFTKGYGAAGGPLGATAKDIGGAITQTSQGEFDKALIKSYINIVGTLTGAPSVQTNRLIDAYWRESEGEDVPLIEYFTGSRN